MYVLTLTIDGEARQLARRARDDGATTVAVIASDTPRQQRFASAFNAEWILAGGGAPVMFRFDPSPDVLRLMRRELAKTPVDAALLAVDAADAALAKPYVGTIPSYTSSQVNERQPPEALRDLDDVRFVDIPWLVDPDAAAFADLKRPDYPNATLDRLYALGMDAFRVAAGVRGRPAGEARVRRRHRPPVARRDAPVRPRGAADAVPRRPHRARRRALDALAWPRARGDAARPARARHWPPRSSSPAASTIVERNFRCRRGEIDLIARDGETLVFVEVRLRTRRDFGGAAASITAAKRARIAAAALFYLGRLPRTPPCRFDAVLLDALDAGAHRMAAGHDERVSGSRSRVARKRARCRPDARGRQRESCYNRSSSDSRPWIMSRASARISPTARN